MPALGLALHGEQRAWATPALGLLGSIPTMSGNLLTHWQGRLLLVEPHEAIGNTLRLVFMFFQSSVFATPLAVVLQQTLGSLVTGSPLTPRGPSCPMAGGHGGAHTYLHLPELCALGWAAWPPALPPPPPLWKLSSAYAGPAVWAETWPRQEWPARVPKAWRGRRAFWSVACRCSSPVFPRSSEQAHACCRHLL